mmetsp:Transcript_13087/g.19757  ORF Transcript_13087/g.19757 Transcript_13087/m.19757 type:complete len:723 (+) Transcript_13087:1776-3944(+)
MKHLELYLPNKSNEIRIGIGGNEAKVEFISLQDEYYRNEIYFEDNLNDDDLNRIYESWKERDKVAKKNTKKCYKFLKKIKNKNIPKVEHKEFSMTMYNYSSYDEYTLLYEHLLRELDIYIDFVEYNEKTLTCTISEMIRRNSKLMNGDVFMVMVIKINEKDNHSLTRKVLDTYAMVGGYNDIIIWDSKANKNPIREIVKEVYLKYINFYSYKQLDYFDPIEIRMRREEHVEKWNERLYNGSKCVPPPKPELKKQSLHHSHQFNYQEEMRMMLKQQHLWDVAFISTDEPNLLIKAHQLIIGEHIHYYKKHFSLDNLLIDDITIIDKKENIKGKFSLLREVREKRQEQKEQSMKPVRIIDKLYKERISETLGSLCVSKEKDEEGRLMIHTSISVAALSLLVQFCYTGNLEDDNMSVDRNVFSHDIHIDKYVLNELVKIAEIYDIEALFDHCTHLLKYEDILTYSRGFQLMDQTYSRIRQQCFTITKDSIKSSDVVYEEDQRYFTEIALDKKGEQRVSVFLPLIAVRSEYFHSFLNFHPNTKLVTFDNESYELFPPLILAHTIYFLMTRCFKGSLEDIDLYTSVSDFFMIPSLKEACEQSLIQSLNDYYVSDPLNREHTGELDSFPFQTYMGLSDTYPTFYDHFKTFLRENHYQANYFPEYSIIAVEGPSRYPSITYEKALDSYYDHMDVVDSNMDELKADFEKLNQQYFEPKDVASQKSCCVIS